MGDVFPQEVSAASEVSESSSVDKDTGTHKSERTIGCREIERDPAKNEQLEACGRCWWNSGILFNRDSSRSRK